MKISNKFKRLAMVAVLATAFPVAQAAPFKLEDAASKALQTSPEVLNKWHQLGASIRERDISKGRYLPTLDVIFGVGREQSDALRVSVPGSGNLEYDIEQAKVLLRQNLFEGFATLNDTKRLEHAILVRFHEMQEQSEVVALEAARAYIDVARYRQLVEFAKENYATHRLLHDKISKRAQSGVGRQVDLETAAGRLALAESNLLTETANLHDVTARYQRIVGSLPPADLNPFASAAPLTRDFPKDRNAGIAQSLNQSPALKAAFHNILSAQRNVEVQKAGYYPRIDAYAEHERNRNGGYSSNTITASGPEAITSSTIGVTASWNLFRGFQDEARQMKSMEEKYSARDQREKVCRDIRQNASISFNDKLRLSEQMKYLEQHMQSTDKTREAFRQQFDRGIDKRSLLDVLDTENEYFTARRNHTNGKHDLLIAYVKYHASAGNLLKSLQLKGLDIDPPQPDTAPDEDMLATCPEEPVDALNVDKESLFRTALSRDAAMRQSELEPVVPVAPVEKKRTPRRKAATPPTRVEPISKP